MKTRYSFSLIGMVTLGVVAVLGGRLLLPAPYIPVTGVDEVSYSKDVQPILESRCVLCHGVQKIRDGLDLRTYASLMKGSKNGPVILPGDVKNSLLIQKITMGEMPKRGPKLFPAQLRILIEWINAGAPDN